MAEQKRNPQPVVNMRPGGRGGPHGPMVREKPKNLKKTVGRLMKYIASGKYLFFALIAIIIVITLLSLAAPTLQGYAIDTIQYNEVTGKISVDMPNLVKLLAFLLGTYVLSSGFTYLQSIIAARLSLKTVHKLRKDLFHSIEHLPIRYIDNHRHGDIMSRMTNDAENISNTVSQSVASLFSGVITLVGTLAIMLSRSPLLTVISLLTVPLTMLMSLKMAGFMRKFFLKQQATLGELNGNIEEMITGYKTVVAYGKEKDAVKNFSTLSASLKKIGIKAQVVGGLMGPLMNVIGNLGYLIVAAAGGWLALEDIITVGTIQTFLLYTKQFNRPINEIANQYASIMTAIAGAERVFAIMDEQPEDVGGDIPLDDIKGDISFTDIHFAYNPAEPVLKGLNLNVKAGQKVAIVGATGSGKTTIVNLLTRFYDCDSGSIKIDGKDIREVPKNELRSNIAIVLQDTVLLTDTIATNIRYGRLDATDEEVREAAKTANADVFIDKMKDGYDTMLKSSGASLSGGQRQLITIARAVLADPKILILDEATSSVDTRTEMNIQLAMNKLMENRTSLIIAHRLSTIRDADMIAVIADGKVAELGNHDELLAQKGHYYTLYQNQFAGLKT